MKTVQLRDLATLKKTGMLMLAPAGLKITVGMATCGIARGADDVFNAFTAELKKQRCAAIVEPVGCNGWCSKEPLVTIRMPGLPPLTLGEVVVGDVPAIVTRLRRGQAPQEKVLFRTREQTPAGRRSAPGRLPADIAAIPEGASLPFFNKQHRIVLRNCGIISPVTPEHYIARGGFEAAHTALTKMSPDAVVRAITRSGLRGRGGAGFPTGRKWDAVRKAEGKQKYIICNADEGDPGAYMDRSILEGDPFSVLEGMIIAGYAVGADTGYMYVRAEYPLAVATVEKAIAALRAKKLLGKQLFGTDFSFRIQVVKGAGAFVCGEETALISSIQGYAGEPVSKPPFPARQGLWNMPTCINNVETLATVPVIMSRGSAWFSRIGTKTSPGTKIFSLVGSVQRVGLIEVPMGTTLREIIFGIGGGIAGGRKLKAVQTGGPSGGCIPARHIDLPVDYERLQAAGSIMGSGGMIVMDDRVCMVDVARYFMDFLRHESCGKCLPCREGTMALYELLAAITRGKGTADDLGRMKNLCAALTDASLCGLGKTAANPVLSTIRHFRKEYMDHIQKRACPAGVCSALITFSIDEAACIGCGACLKACPADAVSGKNGKVHRIAVGKCIACRACFEICPVNAVHIR